MKTYSFIISVSNSTIIEVNAENYDTARKQALDRFYDCGVLSDICNPSDMGVDIELEDEFETKSATTNLVGEREDAEELCRELNEILGRDEFVIASDVPNEEGSRILQVSAENLNEYEVEVLNLNEDFIVK